MIVVVGDVMADVVAHHGRALAHGSDTPARVTLHGGGAAGNVAAWLGPGRARLVARVGDDAMAPVALGGLRGGVDPSRPTGVCVVLVGPDGERTMLPDPGANAALEPPGRIEGGVVYVSGYVLMRAATRDAALAWLAAARAAGARTVVDCASAALIGADLALWDRVGCDLLLANAEEAAVLGDRLRTVAPEVVVTAGAAGARWTGEGRTLDVRAAPATVVDTTGAGDAFAAGFLGAWERGPQAALGAGAALAGRAVAAEGARPPTA